MNPLTLTLLLGLTLVPAQETKKEKKKQKDELP